MAYPKFEIFKGKDAQFYIRLYAGNGQIILSGEGYQSRESAKDAINSIKKNAVDKDNFEVREASNGQPYFVLKAGNGAVLGVSETYSSKANVEKGIASVMNNAPKSEIEDLTAADAPKRKAEFELFNGKAGDIYFRMRAKNGQVLFVSEGYSSKQAAQNGIETIMELAKEAEIQDLTEAHN
ncbi:MAG: YegP family protein [Phaeodactylibacter sp.]|nr:YegP family protein [Phaeodactylibacter sp.]MCB9273188.1 YegP family protein [Lewinellaceae bacterium]